MFLSYTLSGEEEGCRMFGCFSKASERHREGAKYLGISVLIVKVRDLS